MSSYNRRGCFESGDPLDDLFCQRHTCELCGNDTHYGYDCPPQVLFVYNQDLCFNQNFDNNFPQTSQQFPCCENCRGPHETFQCQPMNQNFYNSNSSGFDQFQPPHYSDVHQPPKEISIEELKTMMQSYCEIMSQRREQEAILLQEQAVEEKQELLAEEQADNPSEPSPVSYFYNVDYDIISTQSTTYTIHLTKKLFLEEVKRIQQILKRTSFDAITPDFSITDSLSMGDEHLSTIPETKSDELIKSSVENLVPTPSESEDLSKDLSDIESECDVPVCDNFTTFSNHLFDADDDFSSSDDESFSDEDVLKEIYSNPLFDEEIISTKIDPNHFNAESDLIESLLNRDISIISSPKFDSLLEEFSGELAHIDLIPPGINEADFDPEEEICLVEKLFDSLMEEIDLFLTPDDSIPPGIENDDYDSEGDILFLEELLSNDSPSLPENESFHFDVPSSPRPPAKPPDDGIYFEPDTGLLIAKVVDDISDNSTRELYVHVPNVLPNLPTLSPMFDTLLPFSSENENKVFNSSILASDEEKSPHPLSYRGFKAFQVIFDFSKSPMMIYGEDIPILDVPIALDFEASRARGFVLRSLELQSLA
ncbi:hypothetical protein Tco_1274017 [Tanacetum coccineum]